MRDIIAKHNLRGGYHIRTLEEFLFLTVLVTRWVYKKDFRRFPSCFTVYAGKYVLVCILQWRLCIAFGSSGCYSKRIRWWNSFLCNEKQKKEAINDRDNQGIDLVYLKAKIVGLFFSVFSCGQSFADWNDVGITLNRN